MDKKPIFLISAEGKTKEQMKKEAKEAIKKYINATKMVKKKRKRKKYDT